MPQLNSQEYQVLGGVQTSKPFDTYSEDDAYIAVGGHFDQRKAFTSRRGGQKYNATSLASSGNGIFDFRYDNNAQQKILLAGQSNVYEGNNGVPLPILAGQSDRRTSFAKFNILGVDFAIWSNGVDAMRKYDGTTVSFMSITAPVAAAVAAPNTTGTLPNGTYRIAYTYENALGEESNPSPEVSITLAGANDSIDLTGVTVSTDPQVTLRRIYMTTAGGATLLANTTIPNNTGTTITITTPSAGALLEYDHDTAPPVQFIEPFGSSIAGAGDPDNPSVLYISRAIDVWYWPRGVGSAVDFRINIGFGDPITGIKSLYDNLLVSTESDLFLVSGIADDGTILVSRVKSDDRSGAMSHWTMQVIEGWCWYVGRNSVYRSNGYEIQDVGWCLSAYFSEGSEDDRFRINPNFLGNAIAVAIKAKPHNWYLFSCATSSDTSNGMTFMIDYASVRPDQEAGRIKASSAVWPGFFNQASGIVVTSGVENWYRWDDQGFIFIEDSIDGDGAQISSTATSGGATTLTDTTQAWTADAFIGLFVDIVDGTGEGQRRRITTNTATQITVSAAWDTNPNATSEYRIGGIEYDYALRWDHYGDKNRSKRWRYVRPRFESSGNTTVNLIYAYDFVDSDETEEAITLASTSLFDVGLWDVAFFDETELTNPRISVLGDRIHIWALFRVRTYIAGVSLSHSGYDKLFQMKGMRH